jgi:CBS domain-containing protein
MTGTTQRIPRARGRTAADMMETRVITVRATAPLSEVERVITEHRISGMPVVDGAGRVVGVVSYRDLLDHRATKPGSRRDSDFFRETRFMLDGEIDALAECSASAAGEDTVADVMTPAIVDVEPDATLEEVARTMVRHSIHRVLVIEPESRRVLGIISSLGVLASVAG